MTEIFVYAYSVVRLYEATWIGLALTDKGKWIAGAVSRKDQPTVLNRCAQMARQKAATMLSGPTTVVVTEPDDERVRAAEKLAFAQMP